jgi:hypothetical protein
MIQDDPRCSKWKRYMEGWPISLCISHADLSVAPFAGSREPGVVLAFPLECRHLSQIVLNRYQCCVRLTGRQRHQVVSTLISFTLKRPTIISNLIAEFFIFMKAKRGECT